MEYLSSRIVDGVVVAVAAAAVVVVVIYYMPLSVHVNHLEVLSEDNGHLTYKTKPSSYVVFLAINFTFTKSLNIPLYGSRKWYHSRNNTFFLNTYHYWDSLELFSVICDTLRLKMNIG